MARTVLVTADDYGLSRAITDSILETCDRGVVKNISILANGEAVEYALAEFNKRKDRLMITLHFNITEGPALSRAEDIPHLVDAKGNFCHSVGGLWALYIFGGTAKKEVLKKEVRTELHAQVALIRKSFSGSLGIDGHQHVHMLPFVFDEILSEGDFSRIRTCREPFYIVFSRLAAYASPRVLSRFALSALSDRAQRAALARGIRTDAYFLSFLFSGTMTYESVIAGFAASGTGSIEMAFHPGSAASGELLLWKNSRADTAWHFSPWREHEQALLLSAPFARLISDFPITPCT